VDTKEHIMQVSIQLFSEKGFETTTMRDIASKAAVNLALINYHFGSKEALLKNIFQQRALNIQFHIWEIANNKALDELDKIHKIIEHYVEQMFTNHEFHKVILRELFSSKREEVHADTIGIFTENAKIIIEIINQGIKKKRFNKVDPELCFASIIGTIHHLMYSKLLRENIYGGKDKKDPILQPSFQTRVNKHIKQIIENHLIPAQKINSI
jgi:TetR/AcrR family fatty acid metabolism transcriptional regulator